MAIGKAGLGGHADYDLLALLRTIINICGVRSSRMPGVVGE